MIWQDIVISVCVILMSYALLPQVIKGFKLKKGLIEIQTALLTAIALYILAFIFLNLNFYFSAIMDFIAGIFWTILLFQKIKYN